MDFAHASPISLSNPCLPSKFRQSSAANRLSGSCNNKRANTLQGCEFYSKEPSYYPCLAIKCLGSSNVNSSAVSFIGVAKPYTKRPSWFPSLKPCNVTNESSELSPSRESSTVVDEQILEKELQNAIAEENYSEAARIRDQIRHLHKDGISSVLSANSQFYNAFRKGDLASMQTLWARGEKVCCVHPGTSGISGYEFVMKSWEYVWMNYEFPLEIQLKDIEVYVKGDMGYVTCVEMVKTKGSGWGRQFATNVFEKVNGQWFICIHHASPVDLIE